jgi:hypothetical protein
MLKSNDKEIWEITNCVNTFGRSTGTYMYKIRLDYISPIQDEIVLDVSQRMYRYATDVSSEDRGSLEPHLGKEDFQVALGTIGLLTGLGGIIEAGTTAAALASVVGMINSIDDIAGAFTEGDGSLIEDLSPEQYKALVKSVKTTYNFLNVTKNTIGLTKEGDKAMKTIEIVLDSISIYETAKSQLKKEKD